MLNRVIYGEKKICLEATRLEFLWKRRSFFFVFFVLDFDNNPQTSLHMVWARACVLWGSSYHCSARQTSLKTMEKAMISSLLKKIHSKHSKILKIREGLLCMSVQIVVNNSNQVIIRLFDSKLTSKPYVSLRLNATSSKACCWNHTICTMCFCESTS